MSQEHYDTFGTVRKIKLGSFVQNAKKDLCGNLIEMNDECVWPNIFLQPGVSD